MLKTGIGSLLVLISSVAASAQDLQPALDPAMIAQGQVIAGTHRGYAERNSQRSGRKWSYSRAEDRALCARLPVLRKRHGARHPDVVNVARACRQLGI